MKPGLTLEIVAGRSIADACAEAQALADQLNRGVGFRFNSVECVAVPGGNADDLANWQSNAQAAVIRVHSDKEGYDLVMRDGSLLL